MEVLSLSLDGRNKHNGTGIQYKQHVLGHFFASCVRGLSPPPPPPPPSSAPETHIHTSTGPSEKQKQKTDAEL